MLLSIISFIVLVLVFVSFIPHIRDAWVGKGTKELSLYYLLFNVICSTEHLLFVIFYTINIYPTDLPPDFPDDFPFELYWTHYPRGALDWINFSQVIGVWALFNILLGLNLYHRPTSLLCKTFILVIYTGFLIISLVPFIADAVSDVFCPLDHPNCPWYERDPIILYWGLHGNILLPFFTTIPLVIGIYKQLRSPLKSQSLIGLKLQTAAFILSGFFWVPRVSLPWHLYLDGGHPISMLVISWYFNVGFVTVDDLVFALGQGTLLWLTLRQKRRAGEGERQPLLG